MYRDSTGKQGRIPDEVELHMDGAVEEQGRKRRKEDMFGEKLYTPRITGAKPSFVREILKATEDQEMISFAGGLPNPVSFPKKELEESADRVMKDGSTFQYGQTEGFLPLRQWIAERYGKRFSMKRRAEDILITTGSQQALDLLGKVLLEKGSKIIIEKPSYLGAIQAFSMYEPIYLPVEMDEEGMIPEQFEQALKTGDVKLIYTVPNFQNPSGNSYSKKRRVELRKILNQYEVFLVEDDPYGELRFAGEDLPYIGEGYEGSILLGSFSKTLSPGMRVGYITTINKEFMKYLIVGKQGTDLHTSSVNQRLIWDYLVHNDYDAHIEKIKRLYENQSEVMYRSVKKYFPEKVTVTHPEGGMFLWVDMAAYGITAGALIEDAMKAKVLFVPGDSFYTEEGSPTTMRLNYTNSKPEEIEKGIRILGELIKAHIR